MLVGKLKNIIQVFGKMTESDGSEKYNVLLKPLKHELSKVFFIKAELYQTLLHFQS